MAKAKLVTRSATTSTVTDDNLNKASALTHAEMDSNLINLRDSSFGIADDTSTVLQVTNDKTITVAGGTNITTALSGDTLTITGPDTSTFITASSTDTLTNKTFDANGTGNSISNIETADIAAATLVTAADTIASNNNDTTIPTSAAVKAYADSVGGGGGGTITALNNQAENRLVSIGATTTELDGEANLTFDGSTLTLTGSAALDGVTIADNSITTNRSNDHLHISANGTGKVNISNSDAAPEDNLVYTNGFGTIDRNRGVRIWESVSAQGEMTTSTDRDYGHLLAKEWRLTSGLTSADSDNRYRAFQSVSAVDLNGAAMTSTSSYSGPMGANGNTYLDNSNASAATMNHSTGFYSSVYAYPTAGAITATNTYGVRADIDFDGSSASVSGTNGYLFHAAMYSDGGTTSLTNGYGVYISDLSLATNKYAFYDATNSLSVFGDIQTQAVSITDNLITTNRSNDNLNLETNGTGQIQIKSNGGDFANYSTSNRFGNANLMYYEDLSDTVGDGVRHYTNVLLQNIKLTSGQSSSNSNDRWRNQAFTQLDLNGSSTTAVSNSYRSRGPMGLEVASIIDNSSATASTLGNASGGNYGVGIYPTGTGDITITNTTGMGSYLDVFHDTNMDITITDHVAYESVGIDHYGSGTGTLAITDHYHFRAGAHGDGSTATLSLTNNYGFYFENDSTATNTYAFYDASNSLSRFGAVILVNQASDPSTVTDSAHIYTKDVASSSEVFVRDEAGNVTQISPHNEAGEWQYWSENIKTGKKVRVNMERMIRRLEEITGETFIESE